MAFSQAFSVSINTLFIDVHEVEKLRTISVTELNT
jgi:hypothetical protein